MAASYDDADFSSATMCCACNGGEAPVYTLVLSDNVTAIATAAGSASDFQYMDQNFATAFGVAKSLITISFAQQYSSGHSGRRLSDAPEYGHAGRRLASYSSGTAHYKCPGWYVRETMAASATYSDCQAECTQSADCGATTHHVYNNNYYCASHTA